MPRTNWTKNCVPDFLETLETLGGSSGNKALRQQLDWDEELYWKVQGKLISEGRIVTGRGKGGSVRLPESHTPTSETGDAPIPAPGATSSTTAKEKDLYAPLKASIETKWINRFGLDDVLVDETHSRGAKDTGGTFTRPDITAVGIRRYLYLTKRLEVVAFEVKPAEAVSIMGILEAIAHRESAHRVYVMYATSRAKFEAATDGDRIMEVAQKYGVGIVLTEKVDEVESWEILLDASRHEPDPARLDRFLADLPGDNMKKQLAKWKA
jgi:hypothetical protein